MKVFISQKFRDLTEEEVLRNRNILIDLVKSEYDDVEIIESYHPDFDKNSISQLGRSLIEMSEADLVLLSEISINNIVDFTNYMSMKSLKGSEVEAIICHTYNIPFKVYRFKNKPGGRYFKAEWVKKNPLRHFEVNY